MWFTYIRVAWTFFSRYREASSIRGCEKFKSGFSGPFIGCIHFFCDVEAHTHIVKEGLFETGILRWGYFDLQSWFSLQFTRSWGKICNRAHTKLKGKKKMFSVPSRQKVSPVGNQVDTNKHHFMPNIKCILYANNMTGGTGAISHTTHGYFLS